MNPENIDPKFQATVFAGGSSETPAISSPPRDSDLGFLMPPLAEGEIGWFMNYRVLRKLGQGGMGIVLLAEDTHLKRKVALKVMKSESAKDLVARQRFLREAQSMAAITHDHVVTIYQVGSGEGSEVGVDVPFLAMQYLEGETLEARLLRNKRIPVGETVRIGREIAEGLAAAHARGLIHRDIKLSNIWLEAPSGRVKILDFGLARVSDSTLNLSATGQVLGTPHFMSPEQAAGGDLDHRTDLYSLGCVLYTMLSGELPFDGPSIMAILFKLANEEPPPLQSKIPDLPASLVQLVNALLCKKAIDRPDSATTVAKRLAEIEPECAGVGRELPSTATSLPQSHTTSGSSSPTVPSPTRPTAQAPAGGKLSRRLILGGAGIAALAGAGWFIYRSLRDHGGQDRNPKSNEPAGNLPPSGEPIVVGILHSETGDLRDNEVPVIQMTRLALDGVNDSGGLLGRPVKYLIRNGQSDERVFAGEAERLIVQDGVSVIFGCWTSASRKAVKAVIEEHKHLLIYPVQYEGLEQSPNIIYTGATPNQQILPAVDWCLAKKPAARFFLVGSDYIFPRSANAILRHYIDEKKGSAVGEEYLSLGEIDARGVVAAIQKAAPDFILNTINGKTNQAFFPALRTAGITAQAMPTISFSLDEQLLRGLQPRLVAGDYAAWNYFASIPGEWNAAFVKRYEDRWGMANAVTDPMEAAWLGVQLWARAVAEVKTTAPAAILRSILSQKIAAPEGDEVRVDVDTQHLWKYFRLGQITPEGTFRIVMTHDSPTAPMPYPRYRSREEWEKFQNDLFEKWGKRWSRPPA